MKKFSLTLILLSIIFISNISLSQNRLPEPVKSPFAEAITGNWVSTPYEFMGNTATEELSYSTILNGQFLEFNIKITDHSGFTYEGKEIIKLTEDGTMKGYYFDIFGKEQNLSYTFSRDSNKILVKSSSLLGKGTREIIIDGKSMIQNATFIMTDDSGNEMPEKKISVSYTKK